MEYEVILLQVLYTDSSGNILITLCLFEGGDCPNIYLQNVVLWYEPENFRSQLQRLDGRTYIQT